MKRTICGLVIAIMLLAIPAQAVELEQPPVQKEELAQAQVSIGFGWYTYLKFSKTDVRTITSKWGGVYAGATAVAAAVCSAATRFVISGVCKAAIAGIAWTVWNQFTLAKARGQCVQIAFDYTAWLTGILIPRKVMRYAC